MDREPLPIDTVLAALVAQLRQHSCLVLRAPTGAGKTTRVPPALLDAGLATSGRIVMLEPRRLAARAAARRIAMERGCRLGDEVGYHVRFDRQAGARTRLIVVTPGILLRQLQDNPYLESIDCLLFDEFHERSLDNDLALGMARLIQQTVRPELKIVVMSATLETDKVTAYLGGCPIIHTEGRLFPVDIDYQPRPLNEPLAVAVKQAVHTLLTRTAGDLLVFLPGMTEIRQAARELEAVAHEHNLLVVPLHGDLPSEQQDSALQAQSRRKIVLSTNVAETSVTVEGVTGVLDSGLARLLTHDPAMGLDRLRTEPISRAAADQRAGRAGRVAPGVCVRLWSEAAHRARAEQTEPEIRRVDLAGAVLQLWSLGETDIARFPWVEVPRGEAVEQAFALLQRLEALGERGLSPLGQLLARLPLQPRLGRLLVEGHRRGVLSRTALAAALLSERDPFVRLTGAPMAHPDFLDRLEILERFENHAGEAANLNRQAARSVLQARAQLVRLAEAELGTAHPAPDATSDTDEAVLRALLMAFPDRVARRREPGSRHGLLVGGRGVELAPGSNVHTAELFLCLDVDAGQKNAWVRQAVRIERAWLPAAAVRAQVEIRFEDDSEKVVARRRLCYDDLPLEATAATLPGDAEVVPILATAAATRLERIVPGDDSPAGQYRLRLRCLRAWRPELDLPECTDEFVRDLLPELCRGCRSLESVRRADWLAALQARLTYRQRQLLDQEAPEHFTVPSGSQIALQYALGRPPILAVRIQELFGLLETPRIAGGRVRVLLHLLAPNFRPQQVTEDLASFWSNTYPVVRKELRARYPKHAWPEDPLTARAQPRHRRPTDTS